MGHECTTKTVTTEPPRMTKTDKVFKDGDMTLTSSDGWVFKVDQVFVLANSTAICDAYAASTSSEGFEIEFDNLIFETGSTLRYVLELFTGTLAIPVPSDFSGKGTSQVLVHCRRNLAFADKWGCPQLAHFVYASTLSQLLLTDPDYAVEVYALASLYENQALCRLALSVGLPRGELVYMAPINWSQQVWQDMPPRYAKALVAVCSWAQDREDKGLETQNWKATWTVQLAQGTTGSK